MSKITINLIQEMRKQTGLGMTKCKDALVRSEGNVEKAIEILRKEGQLSALKKEGRDTKEGLIGICQNESMIALVEIDSETDFVVRNEKFVDFLNGITKQAAQLGKQVSLDEFINMPCSLDDSLSIDQYKNVLVQTFGENIQIKRIKLIEKKDNCLYGIYSHMQGKIVGFLEVESANKVDNKDASFVKDIAMHIVSENPEYLCVEDVPQELKEKEKEIALSQIKNKPEHIAQKIVEGKMRTFYEQVVLLEQKFVKDNSLTIKAYLEKVSKKFSTSFNVKCFYRWVVGE